MQMSGSGIHWILGNEIWEMQDRIAGRIQDLEQRKSRLLDAYLDGKVDQDAFQDKKAEIEAQICLSKCEQHDEHLEALDIEAVLRAAERALCNAEALWLRLPLAEKRRLDRLLFPDGIECTREGELRPLGVNPAVELCEMPERQCKMESSNSLHLAPLSGHSWNRVMACLGQIRAISGLLPTRVVRRSHML